MSPRRQNYPLLRKQHNEFTFFIFYQQNIYFIYLTKTYNTYYVPGTALNTKPMLIYLIFTTIYEMGTVITPTLLEITKHEHKEIMLPEVT